MLSSDSEDIKIWLKTCGDSAHAPKGKSTRKKSRVVANDFIEIPKEFIHALFVGILCIDGVTLLLTPSESMRLIATQCVKDKKEASLLEAVDDAFVNCNKAGFEMKEFYVNAWKTI